MKKASGLVLVVACVVGALGCDKEDTKASGKDAASASAKPPPVSAPASTSAPAPTSKPAGEGTPYTSKEGGYSVTLPGEPKESTEPAAAGKAEVRTVVASGKQGSFTAQYSDFPAAPSATKELDATREAMLKMVGGAKLLEEKEIKLDKHPGRSWTIDMPAMKGTLRARAFIVDKRIYKLMVMGSGDGAPAEATKFFDSFKLTPR